ncbi:Protoheme IX farnesyltransferase [Buchnera aphidicola (Tetraneura ulmi)]|uniref:heme o synthase n=1 Tax=Buchnera aphidicola TaxID=9 RepID=UPI003463A3D4
MLLFYLELIKPRIILGNLITMVGGFFFSSKGENDYFLLFLSLIGLTLIISSSCIINNIIDNDLDRLMNRTRNRILVNRKFSTWKISFFSYILGFLGFLIFYFFLNRIVFLLSFIAYFDYLILYTFFLKRNTKYSTYVGGIAGAIPPIIGYCSVSNSFDLCSLILFFTCFIWQIPHFYLIGIKYLEEYKKAKIPIFPVIEGFKKTKKRILFFILFYFLFSSLLTMLNYTGYYFFFTNFIFSLFWFLFSSFIQNKKNYILYIRSAIFLSILVIFNFSFFISFDYIN